MIMSNANSSATMSREEAKRRHEALTQLDVSRSLRSHQRAWFENLRGEVFENKRPYAIVGALVPHEILEALDLPFITDVWYSGLVAAKRQSGYYSNFLDQQGYHRNLSRYAALTLAVLLDEENPDKPWGGLPKPSLLCTSINERSTEIMSAFSGAPFIPIEQPVLDRPTPEWWKMSRWQWEDLDGDYRIDALVAQYQDLIAAAEKVAGKKLDLDRLREIIDRVNAQEEFFDDVRQIISTAPKLPARLGEVMGQVMGIQWHRGTQWAYDQAKAFRDEIKHRADNQMWVCPNEQFRLMYVGQGLWQNLDFFTEFEEKYGAVFVRSNYLSIASDGYIRYGGKDPIRALASRYVTMSEQMHIPGLGSAWAIDEARSHRVVGGLSISGWWGVTTVNRALEEAGIPVLEFPVDAVDGNTWDDAKMRHLVSTFIEERLMPLKNKLGG
jgi:hypothetical protein